ncbi:YggS family pyridoxal phosphate-dependent enzyme [Hathewaya histolytica]|uniref:Pyridoxal phosphate homeostasis protein n=1 Tax=Hathewaya histolytica TaxID=1498 RepID=A0A4U9R8P9_HATHI|nr:YggS family pyridoxal phosphate-dependent enzyme [Hathewaya histolytica]VTQ87935.1 TIM-barrel fold family protein [Hathewaya histolytica]
MAVRENLYKIKTKIPKDVTLICVSKTKPKEMIMEAYDMGERNFGENKVQELVEKYETLPKDIKWHLIGHLQKNKVKYIVDKIYLLHSLDSIELLEEIEKRCKSKNVNMNALIQINIGREETKSGVLEENLHSLLDVCEKSQYVKIRGLMVIIPKGDEDNCRYYFKKTKSIFEELKNMSYKNIYMDYLSMGMSNDYLWSIEEGSNMIRVGQGIFGKRNY